MEGSSNPEINSPTKREVRQFTKSTTEGRQLRKQTAEQILTERREKRANISQSTEISTKVAEIMEKFDQQKIDSIQAQKNIDQLQQELVIRNSSLIKRVFDWIRPADKQNLISHLQTKQGQASRIQTEFQESQQAIQQLQDQLLHLDQTRDSLKDAKETLHQFYKDSGKKLVAFQEAEKARLERERICDLRRIAAENQVYFIHGIRPDILGGQNNANLDRGIRWQAKLDIILGYEIDLAVSTIREGDTPFNMWSRMGVILRSGSVEAASPRDRGSSTDKEGRRISVFYSSPNMKEDIERTIYHRWPNVYNEFSIGNVEIAGFYVCLDQRNSGDEFLSDAEYDAKSEQWYKQGGCWDKITPKRLGQIQEIATALDIPVLLIKQGIVYPAECGIAKNGRAFIKPSEKPISPEDIVAGTFRPSETTRAAARTRAQRYLNAYLTPKPVENEKDKNPVVYPTIIEINSAQILTLKQILESPNFSPSLIIDALKKLPELQQLYESDSGVWEKYTIEQHTIMAMGQFEKYFSENYYSPPMAPLMSRDHFRIMLALHDIGKPLALRHERDSSKQHEYTRRILPQILHSAGFGWKEIDIAVNIATQDFIGKYLKNNLKAEDAAASIGDYSRFLGVDKNNLANLMIMYYMCDAGAYTADAGGKKALDWLFIFNPKTAASPAKMTFSEENQEKINALRKLLVSKK